jgi:hypothetical protein
VETKQSTTHPNRLIAALPNGERQHFLAACRPFDLEFSNILNEPEDRLRYVYFPTGGFLSLTLPVTGHSNLEVALVGN